VTAVGASDARVFWTGLAVTDLRALERAPLDPRHGFALPDRVEGVEGVPLVRTLVAIAEVLGDDGVAVGTDGSLARETLEAMGAALTSGAPAASAGAAVEALRLARALAEAAGLIERRQGRLRLTVAGRRVLEVEGVEAAFPRLVRAWARRPVGPRTRLAEALHALWPLTVLLLHRFGGRWLSVRLYVDAMAEIAPAAVAAASEPGEDAGFEAFANAYVAESLLRFGAFFGLVEVHLDDDDGDEDAAILTTPLLAAALPLIVPQAPAAAAFEDWDGPRENAATAVNRELSAALGEQAFESDDELRAFVGDFMMRRNAAPLDEFDGLSADRMHRLLTAPFEAHDVLVIVDPPRKVPEAPLLHLVLDLAEALGDAGLKATATGNLPRAYVQEAAARYRAAGWRADPLDALERIRTEPDFRDLHVARHVARMAGLVRLHRGRWHLTQAYRRAIARHGAAGAYPPLFRAFVQRYAWSSADGYPDLSIIQASWAFSLLLLHRYGHGWRDGGFYADRFLRAYPVAVDEVEDAYRYLAWKKEPERAVRVAYELRVLERFAAFLGLADVERGRDPAIDGRVLRVRATPALASVVGFVGLG